MSVKSNIINTVVLYKFLQHLTRKWEDTDAYKLGLIDNNGKKLKGAKTTEEKDAYNLFHRLIYNIKRIIQKAPGGGTKIGSLAAGLWLLKESEKWNEFTFDRILSEVIELSNIEINDMISEANNKLSKGGYILVDDIVDESGSVINKGTRLVAKRDLSPVDRVLGKSVYILKIEKSGKNVPVSEDDITTMIKESESAAPTNTVANGAVAGTGHTPDDVIAIRPKRFAGCDVYDVDRSRFYKCAHGKAKYKHWKTFVGEDEVGSAIKQHAVSNPKSNIVLRDKDSGAMLYLRKN